MQKKLFYGLAFSLLATYFFPSCQKELSCENCIDHNQPATALAGPDKPPIARAGPDLTITLPINSVMLDGSKSSDPDGKISGWQWTKISGPSSSNITNANVAQTSVIDLVQGVYLFELKVTDTGALSGRDTIQVTVMAVNLPPACLNCKIVFVSDRDGNAEIYSCNGDGSNISRLTNDAGTDDQPAWSPDRSHIAFVSDRTGSPEIYIMNADGSNVVRRTFLQSYSQNPAWSPDGTRIAYSSTGNNSANMSVVGAESGSPSLLFEEPGTIKDPSWSTDGRTLLLVCDGKAYDFGTEIYTINSDGTNLTYFWGDIFANTGIYFDRYPRWSPSSMNIAFSITKISGDQNDTYNTKVDVMNSDGSGLTTIITSGAAKYTRTSWSADGTMIAYTSLSGTRKDISWVSADGSTSGTIVTNGWNADWQH